jgi:3-hydroxyacyl-CoA dehydrogenase/enoyl-CoA hydratase/3-hydroxybutyryl-CoA epimerase
MAESNAGVKTQSSETRAAATLSFELDTNGIGILTVDVPNEPVNLINECLIEDLEHELSHIEQRVRSSRRTGGEVPLRGLILRSGKPGSFIAGADLKLVRMTRTVDEATTAARRVQALCNRLEALPIPTVAALDGAALGGGLEIALACDYRIATESSRANIGLVEVQVGLIPAGGGTQRLPRLVGLVRGLDLILNARRLTPWNAQRLGIIDEVVHPTILLSAACELVLKAAAHEMSSAALESSGVPRWPPRVFTTRRLTPRSMRLSVVRDRVLRAVERFPFVRILIYDQTRRRVHKRTKGHYPAPLAALDAVRTGREHGMQAGLDVEARLFGTLATGAVAHNLIDIFFASNELKKEQRAEYTDAVQAVDMVGVVGTGFMGAGIAQLFAASGFEVRMRDSSPEALARGLKTVHDLTMSAHRRGRFTRYEAIQIESRVSATAGYNGFKRADVVIEAVFEDLAVKQRVVAELEDVLRDDAIIASNTSSLPIGQIAARARIPERVVGMHFFSPVHRMPLLEVVRGEKTSKTTVATAVIIGQRLGKTVIVVSDGPGFYTTRVLGFMLYEAALLFEEGATIDEIDRAMVEFGFPVGPLALMDEVGLDVGAHAGETLHSAFPDRLPASQIVPKLLASGRLGRKSGRGFYDYRGKRKRPDSSVYALRTGNIRPVSKMEIQERLSLLFINEAARCLGEGIIRQPRDGDVGAVMGVGFPAYLGGPFHYSDAQGIRVLCDRLQRLAERYGPRFAPAPTIVELAAQAGRFYE